MKKPFYLFFKIFLLFLINSVIISACTWTYDYDLLHISRIKATNRNDTYLISVNDVSDIERTVAFDISTKKFLNPEDYTETSFLIESEFEDIKFTSELRKNLLNETIWHLKYSNGSLVFEKKIDLINPEIKGIIVSSGLGRAYLIVLAEDDPDSHSIFLLISNLDVNSAMINGNFDYQWQWYENTEWQVNENELLLRHRSQCCICGISEFYRFDENSISHIYSTDYVAKINLFDPRTNRFISLTYDGTLNIFNYATNEKMSFNLDLQSLDTYYSSSLQISTTTISLGLILIAIMSLITYRRFTRKDS
jgi:hypothetical protein